MPDPAPIVDAVTSESADPQRASDDAQNERVELVLEELLVEDVSIDGMCGVY